ncbi:hypothetical protein PGT21_029831 [Puccinia graminis f. sp. tritici]|uniref:Uncharacterized protein n=1 Tax=Puccinia graminis f. sp. tritici TaxID=56615 RepID=A0A5B0QXI4_PUCGR|nr:hypothetical protein PGT21_029831 [Puccinia graminis f. sp. tritici]
MTQSDWKRQADIIGEKVCHTGVLKVAHGLRVWEKSADPQHVEGGFEQLTSRLLSRYQIWHQDSSSTSRVSQVFLVILPLTFPHRPRNNSTPNAQITRKCTLKGRYRSLEDVRSQRSAPVIVDVRSQESVSVTREFTLSDDRYRFKTSE